MILNAQSNEFTKNTQIVFALLQLIVFVVCNCSTFVKSHRPLSPLFIIPRIISLMFCSHLQSAR